MSEALLDKSPSARHSLPSATAASLQQLPVRRMRNTAVLVKWIEEHQSNPYPTKAEKQYLAYYSGMNMTQLSTWFANARRRIKKIGMKTWLEGRSTFTVDFFPAATTFTSRPALPVDYVNGSGATYNNIASANPYYSAVAAGSYQATNQHTPALGLPNHRMYNSADSMSLTTSASSVNYGHLYASTTSRQTPLFNLSNWSPSTPSLLSSSTHSAVSSLQMRPSSNTGPTLHSPLTAQVYSDPNADASLRTQAGLDMSEAGPYSLAQHSPDQLLPECASAEPMLQGSSPKTHYSAD